MRASTLTLGLLLTSAFCVPQSSAQIKASERSTIKQTIDGTVITIEYGRPSRRGRDKIFGEIMPWGEVWTPGADRATRIEFSKDVTIDGNAVPAGSYSLWMAISEGEWEVALSENIDLFHFPHLVLDDDQIRFFVTPREHVEEMETLSFSFPAVYSDGALLRMHWGKTFVEMDVKVESTHRMRATEEEAAPYVGRYLTITEPDPAMLLDSREFELVLVYENEFLSGVLDMGWEEGPMDTSFAPVSDGVFHPVQMMGGVPAGLIEDVFVEFEFDGDGKVVRFEARTRTDDLWFSGTRIN